MLIPWLLFPLVLAALALGCGLLLERASGASLPRPLLLPAGLAVIIVAALFPLAGWFVIRPLAAGSARSSARLRATAPVD